MVHWDAFNNPIPILDKNNTIAVRMGLIHINHHVQEQFKIAGEIEDLKVARKLQQEKEDAKLAMEFQYFECGNLMSELQNLHPDDKKEYFDRNALFFQKCRKEIKIQNEGNPTTINTPKLDLNSAVTRNCCSEQYGICVSGRTKQVEIIRMKKQSYLIDCTATTEPTAPPEPCSPTKPGEPEIVVLHDEDFHVQKV